MARQQKFKLPEDIEVHADVSIGPPEGADGFALAVALLVKGSYEPSKKSELEKVVQDAHKMCPYSKAVYV